MNNISQPAKLNLGCGFKKHEGYTNVDSAPECRPDVVWNLERTPWPWEDSSIDEIRLEHVLEHLGQTTEAYLAVWKEIWRVCKNGAILDITVPHWNHENFHHDPTHVRAITPVGVAMFDNLRNIRDAEAGGRETKLGLFAGIDIDLQEQDVEYFYSGDIVNALNRGEFDRAGLEHLRNHQNNISNEIRMKARVIKPVRGAQWLRDNGYVN